MKQTIRVRKRGNSLILPIPTTFAEQLDLRPDTPVRLLIDGDRLVVAPIAEPAYALDELLAGFTEKNRHDEFDTGAAAGHEVW